MRGIQVNTAFSGEEALSLLETFQPQVMILDLMMPGMSGWHSGTCKKTLSEHGSNSPHRHRLDDGGCRWYRPRRVSII